MNTNETRDPRATADSASPEVWSRHGSAMVVTTATTGPDSSALPDISPLDAGRISGPRHGGGWPDVDAASEGTEGSRTHDWSLILSGPALALAALIFAAAQAVSGFIASEAATLIPGAADSPANHVRVIAVIHAGVSCAGLAFAWLALRRTAAEDPTAPRWATYAAGAAILISILVVLQAGLLLMLSMLVPPT